MHHRCMHMFRGDKPVTVISIYGRHAVLLKLNSKLTIARFFLASTVAIESIQELNL